MSNESLFEGLDGLLDDNEFYKEDELNKICSEP